MKMEKPSKISFSNHQLSLAEFHHDSHPLDFILYNIDGKHTKEQIMQRLAELQLLQRQVELWSRVGIQLEMETL